MPAISIKPDLFSSPLDIAESVMLDRDWVFDRLDEGQIIAEYTGTWCNYKIWLQWMEEVDGMTISCGLESKIAKKFLPRIYELMALANEKMWLGNFEYNTEMGVVVFRHALLLPDGVGANAEQLQDILDIAVQECERFYPAFQSVIWGGKAPQEAMEIALFETIAEA